MITKAEVQRKQGNNKYLVRIPLFEWAGEKQEFIEPATVCYSPGAVPAYKTGDIVFVSFENNNIGKPVIIGKLYIGDEDSKKDSVAIQGATLAIKTKAELPSDLKIGNIPASTLNYILKNYKLLEERVKKLEEGEE